LCMIAWLPSKGGYLKAGKTTKNSLAWGHCPFRVWAWGACPGKKNRGRGRVPKTLRPWGGVVDLRKLGEGDEQTVPEATVKGRILLPSH